MQTTSPELQARLWLGVVRTSMHPRDQAHAYMQASYSSDCSIQHFFASNRFTSCVWLQATQCLAGSFSQCYVLVDFAEWLTALHYPPQQARDALNSAVDILLRVRGPKDVEANFAGGKRRGPGFPSPCSLYLCTHSLADSEGGARSGMSSSNPPRSSLLKKQVSVSGLSAGRASQASGDLSRRSGATSPQGTARIASSTVIDPSNNRVRIDWPASLEAGHVDLLVSRRTGAFWLRSRMHARHSVHCHRHTHMSTLTLTHTQFISIHTRA
jgi:hypothetical protein